MHTHNNTHMLRLKAVAAVEADTLTRALHLFEEHDVVPQRVIAQRVRLQSQTREVIQIEIELAATDIALDALRLIAHKIAQMPNTLSTVFSQDPAQSSQAGTQALVIPITPPTTNP